MFSNPTTNQADEQPSHLETEPKEDSSSDQEEDEHMQDEEELSLALPRDENEQ